MRTNHKTRLATFAFYLAVMLTFASEHAWANRYYSPGMGRFISRDAVGYVEGMNLHEYVKNRPTFATDPFGSQFLGGVLIFVEVESLIEDLASPSFQARQFASRRLLELLRLDNLGIIEHRLKQRLDEEFARRKQTGACDLEVIRRIETILEPIESRRQAQRVEEFVRPGLEALATAEYGENLDRAVQQMAESVKKHPDKLAILSRLEQLEQLLLRLASNQQQPIPEALQNIRRADFERLSARIRRVINAGLR